MSDLPVPKIVSITHISVPAQELINVLVDVMQQGLTGKLVVNFSQGRPAGTVEWQQSQSIKSPSLTISPS